MKKKHSIIWEERPNQIAKALLTMKLTFLLIIVGVLQASANVKAQNKISLKLEQVQINQVLSFIEKQSEFRFLYNNQLKNLQQRVNINVSNEDIGVVLNTLFTGQDLTYKML